MTITESLVITQTPDGTSETGSRLEVRQTGTHEIENPASTSSIAFMMTTTLFYLIQTGVVAETMQRLYGIEVTGSMKLETDG